MAHPPDSGTQLRLNRVFRLVATMPTPVRQRPPPDGRLPATVITAAITAIVTAAIAAVITTVTTITAVHRCRHDAGRLSRSWSCHGRRGGGDGCRGSCRHQQRCDVVASQTHGGTPSIGCPVRAYLLGSNAE